MKYKKKIIVFILILLCILLLLYITKSQEYFSNSLNNYNITKIEKKIFKSDYPIFVNFYTGDNGYETVVPYLIDSLNKLNLPYYIVEINSNGDKWEKICQQKPYILQKVMNKYPNKNIVWIDADAVIEKMPREFLKINKDIGVCYIGKENVASGTIFFKNNKISKQIIIDWINENNKNFKVWDGKTLNIVLNRKYKKHIHILPKSYVGIFNKNAIISQWQFSRNIKPKNSYEKGFNPNKKVGKHPSRYNKLILEKFTPNSFPKILHHIFWDFTGKNRKIDKIPEFNACQNSWLRYHPDWTHYLWDKPDMDKFVKKHFSQYFNEWDNLNKKIKKVDMFRYMVLYVIGGLYSDLDLECFMNYNNLLNENKDKDIILYCHGTEKKEICNNGIMISKPNNEFWIDMIHYGLKNKEKGVLSATGPPVLGKLAFNNYKKYNIKLLDNYHDKILQRNSDTSKFCCNIEDSNLKKEKEKKYIEWKQKGYHIGNFHCTPKNIHWSKIKN